MKFPWTLISIIISQESIIKIDSIQKRKRSSFALLFNLPPLYSQVVVSVHDLPGSICLSICVRVYIVFVVRLVQFEFNVIVAATHCFVLLLLFTTSNRLVRQGFRSEDRAIGRAYIQKEGENDTKGLPFYCSSFEQNNNGPLKKDGGGWRVIREHIKEKRHNMMFFKRDRKRTWLSNIFLPVYANRSQLYIYIYIEKERRLL